MTVYELIQKLSENPANCEIRVLMFADNKHMENYLTESQCEGRDWADVSAEPLRLRQNWNSTMVTLECQSEDL